MATLMAKTYVIPVITSMRTTCAGDQYTVETPDFIDIVTVNGERVTCTCHEVNCSHVRFVSIRRAQDAEKNARRDMQSALFNL